MVAAQRQLRNPKLQAGKKERHQDVWVGDQLTPAEMATKSWRLDKVSEASLQVPGEVALPPEPQFPHPKVGMIIMAPDSHGYFIFAYIEFTFSFLNFTLIGV